MQQLEKFINQRREKHQNESSSSVDQSFQRLEQQCMDDTGRRVRIVTNEKPTPGLRQTRRKRKVVNYDY